MNAARTVILGLVVSFLATSAFADQITIPAEKDNTLYDTGDERSNGAGQYMFAGRTVQFGRRRAVMQFDVAGSVPAGSIITDVSLSLHMSKTIVGDQNCGLHFLTHSWGEGTSDAIFEEGDGTTPTDEDCTWTYRFFGDAIPWDTPGGDYATVPSAVTTVGNLGFYAWSSPAMAADVQGWLDDPASNNGWVLIGPEDVTSAKRFDTRENPTVANRPALTITYEASPCDPCDANCDGALDFLDVEPFIDLLLGNIGQCDTCTGDTNGDGSINLLDIEGFIDCLLP
jgi:hypothetical protein